MTLRSEVARCSCQTGDTKLSIQVAAEKGTGAVSIRLGQRTMGGVQHLGTPDDRDHTQGGQRGEQALHHL